MKFLLPILAFVFLTAPMNLSAMDKREAKPTILMFFSANCGACKILDPRIKEALSQFKEGDFNIIVFDFSSHKAIKATKELSANKGLDHILEQYGARTGFVALLDHDKQVVDKITVDDNVAAMRQKLNILL